MYVYDKYIKNIEKGETLFMYDNNRPPILSIRSLSNKSCKVKICLWRSLMYFWETYIASVVKDTLPGQEEFELLPQALW